MPQGVPQQPCKENQGKQYCLEKTIDCGISQNLRNFLISSGAHNQINALIEL